MNTKQIRDKLEVLIDASRNQSLKELKAIKHIGVDPDRNLVILIITIGELAGEAEKTLRHQIAKVIKLDLQYNGVKIQFEEEKKIIGQKTKFIIVASGKGGVGKSFVTVNLAYQLKAQNASVGIIDADIYSACIPDLLEMPILPVELTDAEKIIPFSKDGIEVISTEFFSERDKPILWRGDQLQNILNSFFYQVQWSNQLDYILIDAPSGTGDIMLDLKKVVPNAEIILVTTPDILDCHIVTKTGIGYLELNHNIIGIVENKANLNKESYASVVAEKLNVEVLTSIPYSTPKNNLAIYEDSEENAQLFKDLATLIIIR